MGEGTAGPGNWHQTRQLELEETPSSGQSPAHHLAERLSELPKTTQLISLRASIETQPVASLWCFGLCTPFKSGFTVPNSPVKILE